MARFIGSGGKVTLNGKEFGMSEWTIDTSLVPELDAPLLQNSLTSIVGHEFRLAEIEVDPVKWWWFFLRACKITVTMFGHEIEFEGYCNEEQTRVYLRSRIYAGKFFLKHVVDEGKTLRHERISYDIDDARRWVIFG